MTLRLAPLLLFCQLAHADPVTLRIAAIAPDGTQWAREMKAFARGVETATAGEVRIKYYFGGIAGDEVTALDRARRGQLSGNMGALLCEQLAPSLRVLRVPGLVRTREEARHVVNAMHAEIAAEMKKAGFVYMGAAGFGLDVLFTRKPVTSLAELRATKLWLREHDDVMRTVLTAVGAQLVMLPHADAARAYDDGLVDGFIAPPASALSFQWTSQVHAFTDFKLGYLVACAVLTNAAFDPLATPQKEQIMTQAALLASRFEEVNRDFDAQLLGTLLAHKGLHRIVPSRAFDQALQAALEANRNKIDPALVPPPLLERVAQMLDDYRRKSK